MTLAAQADNNGKFFLRKHANPIYQKICRNDTWLYHFMLCVTENVPAVSVCQNLFMNHVVCSRWGNFPFVFNLLETKVGPKSPFSFSAEPYWRMSCAGVSCLAQSEGVRVCVCVAHRKHRGDVEVVGAERVFHGSCTSVCCISLGVVFQLWEKGITPYNFFHSPISFLAMPITRATKHTLTNSQSHRKPDWYGRQLVSAVWAGCVILFHPLTWQQFCTGLSSLRPGPRSKNRNLGSGSANFKISLVMI